MTKTPDLPIFSGELPTPKGEVEFDNWIFQIKSLQKTFTDDAIRNAVVANARGIAKTVVHAVGYDAELSLMISHLEDRFGLGETNDTLLLEFHQMSQGANEKVQDFGCNSIRMRRPVVREVTRREVTLNPLKLNRKTSPRDRLYQQQAPSQGVSLQSSAIGAWGGAISCATAQTGNLFKEVLNGETCMGRWLPRVQPFPRRRSILKTNSNFQSHGGRGVWL